MNALLILSCKTFNSLNLKKVCDVVHMYVDVCDHLVCIMEARGCVPSSSIALHLKHILFYFICVVFCLHMSLYHVCAMSLGPSRRCQIP